MREIKFRGLSLDRSEWVVGFYWSLTFAGSLLHNIRSVDKSDDFPVIPETVGQYTGLKDANGVEIYEGDTIRIHHFYFDGNESENELIGTIAWSEFGWQVVKIQNAEFEAHTGYDPNEGWAYFSELIPSNWMDLKPSKCDKCGTYYAAILMSEIGNQHEESYLVLGNIHQPKSDQP